MDQLRERFEVVLIESNTTLWEKLKYIYDNETEDFVRVDADVIPNMNLEANFISQLCPEHTWWLQFLTFDWFKQDVTHGGVQYIKAEAIPHIKKRMNEAMNKDRPETHLSRIPEFYEPRRFDSHPIVMGLQGYRADPERVRAIKDRRNQLDKYDFGLAERIGAL